MSISHRNSLSKYLASSECDPKNMGDGVFIPALVTGMELLEAIAKLEAHSDFELLQTLSEGAQTWFGFRPGAALADHREFLNEVLAANEIQPFLLRLSGAERDFAANLLGRAIVAAVPSDKIDDLPSGHVRLADFPSIAAALRALKEGVLEQSAKESPTAERYSFPEAQHG